MNEVIQRRMDEARSLDRSAANKRAMTYIRQAIAQYGPGYHRLTVRQTRRIVKKMRTLAKRARRDVSE